MWSGYISISIGYRETPILINVGTSVPGNSTHLYCLPLPSPSVSQPSSISFLTKYHQFTTTHIPPRIISSSISHLPFPCAGEPAAGVAGRPTQGLRASGVGARGLAGGGMGQQAQGPTTQEPSRGGLKVSVINVLFVLVLALCRVDVSSCLLILSARQMRIDRCESSLL